MVMDVMQRNKTISRFDKASVFYRTDSVIYRKLSADKVSQLLDPASNDVILDIGCGTGTQLIELAGKIKMGIGIDISSGMIQRATALSKDTYHHNLEFYVGDFLSPEKEVSLRKIGINKIISNYALHHLPLIDKKKALEKMISITGENLEMIVIGDLMFFDNPELYSYQYDQIGYGPGTDLPCFASELSKLFEDKSFIVDLSEIHPLVGVLKAVRSNTILMPDCVFI